MKSKRGQDLTIGTLVLIALGVVVLVLLVLGFWKGWDFVFGFLDLAGDTDLDVVAKKCATFVPAGFTSSYCSFVKVTYQGQTEYISCHDSRIQAALLAQGVSTTGQSDCSTEKTSFCSGSTLTAAQKERVKVDNTLCPPPNSVEQ